MKDLNWEQGLIRVYCVLWALVAVGMLLVVVINNIPAGLAYWFGFVVILPAILLKVLRWSIPWFVQGFVRKT